MNYEKLITNIQNSRKYLLFYSDKPNFKSPTLQLIKCLDVSRYTNRAKYLLLFKL